MIDSKELLRTEVDALTPVPTGQLADWNDVVRRSEGPVPRWRGFSEGVRRRALVVTVGVVLVAGVTFASVPASANVTRAWHSFAAWITGEPGKEPSSAEKRAFHRDQRSWIGFPESTELRKLVVAHKEGAAVTLFGFRDGDALCLRVVASGTAAGALATCLPLSALENARTTGVIAGVDYTFVRRTAASRTLLAATIGFVANDAKLVEVQQSAQGSHRARTRNGAFLDLVPVVGKSSRTVAVWVTDRQGDRRRIPLARAPVGRSAQVANHRPVRLGPTTVDRHVRSGGIGWLEQHRPVGEPVPADLRYLPTGQVLFRRMLTPDQAGTAKVVVSLMGADPPVNPLLPGQEQLCFDLRNRGGGSGGCTPPDAIFRAGPLAVAELVVNGGDQFTTVWGVASDEVATLRLFLAGDQQLQVPLRNNTYAVDVARTQFPGRLVAYDGAGRVIGLEDLPTDGVTP
jgi:hypothetical protein